MSATTWSPPPAGVRYGISTHGPATTATTELSATPTPGVGAEAAAQPWNPANPLFWFGAVAALTFGLMAFSTSVRIGGTKASVPVGK